MWESLCVIFIDPGTLYISETHKVARGQIGQTLSHLFSLFHQQLEYGNIWICRWFHASSTEANQPSRRNCHGNHFKLGNNEWSHKSDDCICDSSQPHVSLKRLRIHALHALLSSLLPYGKRSASQHCDGDRLLTFVGEVIYIHQYYDITDSIDSASMTYLVVHVFITKVYVQ